MRESTRATWTDFARPIHFSTLTRIQLGSNSYHARPCRADVGCAWRLLCQPSPKLNSATHHVLRESSRVLNRRLPNMWVAEFTAQVMCRPATMRRHIVHRNIFQPPSSNTIAPNTTFGTQ